MSNFISTDFNKIETVLMTGDLSRLNPQEKVSYYNKVCESVGLNPLTQPFAYIKLNGKEVLYATRAATDQVRSVHKVALKITARELMGDVYVVTAQATTPDGRTDESTGAVAVGSLKGEALANAYMKAETKAKRRVTLSICGLGLLDETEVDSIPGAQKDVTPVSTSAPPKTETVRGYVRVEPENAQKVGDNSAYSPRVDTTTLGIDVIKQIWPEAMARKITQDELKNYVFDVYGAASLMKLTEAQASELLALLQREDTNGALLKHLGEQPAEPESAQFEPEFDENLDFLTEAAAKPATNPSVPYSDPRRVMTGVAFEVAVNELRTFGKAQGYRDDEMSDLLFQRLHTNEWDKLTPFNIQLMRKLFEQQVRAKVGGRK